MLGKGKRELYVLVCSGERLAARTKKEEEGESQVEESGGESMK